MRPRPPVTPSRHSCGSSRPRAMPEEEEGAGTGSVVLLEGLGTGPSAGRGLRRRACSPVMPQGPRLMPGLRRLLFSRCFHKINGFSTASPALPLPSRAACSVGRTLLGGRSGAGWAPWGSHPAAARVPWRGGPSQAPGPCCGRRGTVTPRGGISLPSAGCGVPRAGQGPEAGSSQDPQPGFSAEP